MFLFFPASISREGDGEGVRSGDPATDMLLPLLLCLDLAGEPEADPLTEADLERLRADSFLPDLVSLKPSESLSPAIWVVIVPSSKQGTVTAFVHAATTSLKYNILEIRLRYALISPFVLQANVLGTLHETQPSPLYILLLSRVSLESQI